MADDEQNIRMHDHFYHALFMEDWTMDLRIKRYVRDKLRFKDEFFCAAARIVRKLRRLSHDGRFYTYHVRRNDFAHIHLLHDSNTLYWSTHELIPNIKNATIYIATDEKDKSWFQPFMEKMQYGHVYFLDDFKDELDGIRPGFYGIIDAIVAARGEVFVGAYYSTLTMHINHMRGYYSQVEQGREGWKQQLGVLDSYFYAPKEYMNFFRHYRPFGDVKIVDTAFPIAWRDIDHGILDEQ
mmetsp:Transcript_5156/g.9128  ORF Transcript_5156/g.9128 Transcript_5156/m.9128 type:complete len:239 (+) Transcript_5156:3-719(+)